MARDLRGQRRDKAIYLALVPAGDALPGRHRPRDKHIRKRIRLTGDQDLPEIPGEDAGLLRGNAGQPARHHDPRVGYLGHRQGPARPSRAGHYLTDPSKEPDPAKRQADMAYLTNHVNAHCHRSVHLGETAPDWLRPRITGPSKLTGKLSLRHYFK
jgi:hypothetical protein